MKIKSLHVHTLLLIGISLLYFSSCKSKYPSKNYIIPEYYRELVASYKAGDTLRFVDDKKNLSLYLITGIDSSFVDEGRGLMKVRGRKDISISCRDFETSQEYNMFILNKYPDEDSATFSLRLKDFYETDSSKPFVLLKDTIFANEIVFTNYYSFHAMNRTEQKNTNSVTEIYMTNEHGIIAYKTLGGTWWTKVK